MKFIHIADVHLGAKPERAKGFGTQRGQEIWKTFHRLIDRVIEEKADLLLIAGDLFHDQPQMRELKEVNYLFEKLNTTKVVLIMGNHDYIRRDSAVLHFQWAENVICLFGQELESVFLEELHTTIYGLSYHDYEVTRPLYENAHPETREGCHILLAHGGDDRHSPISRDMLVRSGFDYIALGHIHKPEILLQDRAAYSGSLEPIDRNETGKHGYMRGTYTDGMMEIEFVPFAQRDYIHFMVRSTPEMTDLSMRDAIAKEISLLGRNHLYKVVLNGYRDPDITFQISQYGELGNIVEIQDQTEPDIDIAKIYQEHKGDACGKYIARLNSTREPMSEIQKKALLYGIQALLGEN